MPRKSKNPVPALEWASAAVGLVFALTLIGIVGREALAGPEDNVPVLSATVERTEATSTGHVVEVRLHNASSQSAAAVQIEGKIGSGASAETSSATIDYVPGRSEAEAGLIFTRDPRKEQFALRVTGYEIP